MAKVYLGLGSNIGDKKQNITNATIICGSIMGKILGLSSIYESEPWGFLSENNFLNAAVCIETTETPERCLEMAKAIEREMGRKPRQGEEYEDRIIDIDLLLYDDIVMQTEALTIPHPHLTKRMFVLQPLAEIAPEVVHPIRKQAIQKLFEELKADLNDKK